MANFLGIDMGGTATRWALVGADGALKARGTAPGATGNLFSPVRKAEFSAVIEEIARQVASPVNAAYAGITGLGTKQSPEANSIIGGTVGCPPSHVQSTDDIELAFRALFAPGQGHLVLAGTGSVGMHITQDGEIIRVGGRGILVDDAGAGAWIALRAIDAVCRRIDETGTPADASRLAEALYAAVGGREWDDIRAFVYGSERGRIGGLARAVGSAAQAGDPVARGLLDRAADELARLARALIARAGPAPIAFVGGALALDPAIPAGIAAALPGAEVSFPSVDAALAAAHIARDHFAASERDTNAAR